MMNTLFNLDDLPVKSEPEARRWYISVLHQGKEFVLCATHNNGANDWKEVGTFKHQPLLYKTSAGARRMGHEYTKAGTSVMVKEWKGWS